MHTTGINWQSIGAIGGLLAIAVTILLYVLNRRDTRRAQIVEIRDREMERRNEEIKNEIATAVDHLSDVLTAKLETKETVARISERLARVEGASGIHADP